METILRSKEMAEIKLLPVRHHSPACAVHVMKMIEKWEPDAILIEGPDNANEWIPVMTDENTKAPFAVYYYYDDTTGKISEEEEKYKCYYPFLDYSPELAALRMGRQKGIYTAFIDMSYGDILAVSEEGKGLLKEAEKHNYNDDYLLTRSAYVKLLCEKTGMRGFHEFWEKYFEIDGLELDSEQWFENLLVHCRLSREYSTQEELRKEGCLQREQYMAKRIAETAQELSGKAKAEQRNNRILVITGGFHTPALKARLLTEQERRDRGIEEPSKESYRKVPAKDQGVFMMPYSMEAADALNGYASGMPFPGFYQTVWEQRDYEATVFQYIISCGKAVRKKEGGISTYDEICACNMAKGLAALRGKKQPGAYELEDCVLSNFIKGENTVATDFALRELYRQMRGNVIGKLCENAEESPIIQDFRQQCKTFRLKIASTAMEEMTLSVFSKEKHRSLSMFFHQMTFLNTHFAARMRGPNLQLGRDRNLIRETWRYKWDIQVMSALIDVSVYGATVREAVQGIVKEKLKKNLSAKESALLLTQLFEMGFDEQPQVVYEKVYDSVLKDTDFYSLTFALNKLTMLDELCGLYRSQLDLKELLAICCRKAIHLLPAMTRVKEENMTGCMSALKTLYQVTGKKLLPDALVLRESYLHALFKMDTDKEIQAGVHGCIHGILYGSGKENVNEIEAVCRGYLSGTKEQSMRTAMFFHGLFFTAKDLVFVGKQFIEMLDGYLKQMDTEDFLRLLPELRMAFTYFTPAETDRIAGSVAAIYGKEKGEFLEREAVSEELLKYGAKLDDYISGLVGDEVYGK